MTFCNISAEPLLIVGASTRAAAFSALAGDMVPQCVDLFADADLADCCTAVAARDYPRGLPAAADAMAAGPWMYTGALENHVDLIDTIAKNRTLYGNPGPVVARVRDPWLAHEVLASAGLLSPEVRRSPAELPRDGSWLLKPCRSSGGRGITPWTEEVSCEQTVKERYFQRFVAGRACAAIFLAGVGRVELLGATEQLLVRRHRDTGAFTYAGSCGPLVLDDRPRRTLTAIGEVLAERFGLVGLFGVDYVDDGHDLWPVEINPRYTASVEILERAYRLSAVARHVAVCRGETPPSPLQPSGTVWHAKRILYATEDLAVTADFSAQAMSERGGRAAPLIADVPPGGTEIPAGAPVMTVFAQGDSRDACLASLARVEGHWRQRMTGSGSV